MAETQTAATSADRDTSQEPAERERLLKEYELNVELLEHDDTLRQARTGNFLSVNSVLVVGLGALFTLKPDFDRTRPAILLVATFGLLICVAWHVVQVRNSEYVRFRRAILTSIENRLPPLVTFTATQQAFYDHLTVRLPALERPFAVHGLGRFSSTRVENRLPFLMAMLWLSVEVITLTVSLARAA